jgi:cytochrome c oxidase subunit 3
MFFGGMFTGYAVYRALYPDAFSEASRHLDIVLGAFNTAVLLCSSLTMALAVRAAQVGSRRVILIFLILTMILGGVFLGVKGFEYYHKFEENLIPGPLFQYEGAAARQVQLFLSFYFTMTAWHALHMIIGIALMLVILWMAYRDRFSPGYYSPVEMMGLYWHFVDIVWVFLFPLLYLVDRT